jgi:hypothetical protein
VGAAAVGVDEAVPLMVRMIVCVIVDMNMACLRVS